MKKSVSLFFAAALCLASTQVAVAAEKEAITNQQFLDARANLGAGLQQFVDAFSADTFSCRMGCRGFRWDTGYKNSSSASMCLGIESDSHLCGGCTAKLRRTCRELPAGLVDCAKTYQRFSEEQKCNYAKRRYIPLTHDLVLFALRVQRCHNKDNYQHIKQFKLITNYLIAQSFDD